MDNLDVIVRGFLYKENWVPISNHRKGLKYTIDFLNIMESYKTLLEELSKKYNISLYFSTYETLPKKKRKSIEKEFVDYSPTFFLSEEKGSTQFTTPIHALKKLSQNGNNKLLIRGDLIITEKLIGVLIDAKITDNVRVLFKSGELVNDTVHLIHSTKAKPLIEFFTKNKISGHKLHQHIETTYMVSIPYKANTYNVSQYYEIYDSTIHKDVPL